MKIYLVAYGDDNYACQREHFYATALKSSLFDQIFMYSQLNIDPIFYTQVYEPIRKYRGGGYWIWKPYFVKKALDRIKTGDILVYCDAGCTINGYGKSRFNEYIEMACASNTGTVDFSLIWAEFQYTKREVFEFYNCPDRIINSTQLHSTVLILKKCTHTSLLVEEWYRAATDNTFLFTDEKRLPQHSGFIDHRHDQSVFSVLRKNMGANIINDEVCYIADGIYYGSTEDLDNYPFWSTRLIG